MTPEHEHGKEIQTLLGVRLFSTSQYDIAWSRAMKATVRELLARLDVVEARLRVEASNARVAALKESIEMLKSIEESYL